MTKIKLTAISTITAVMIMGSTLVFAAAPASDPSDVSVEPASVTTSISAADIAAADPAPVKRGGGSARATKK